MKNKLLSFIFLLFITGFAYAQSNESKGLRLNTDEQLFGSPKPYTTPVNFTFVNNQNKAVKIYIEMYAIHQLNNLPNLDSILNEAKQNLSSFADSFKNDAIARSIDYLVVSKMAPQFRINNNNPNANNFTFRNKELVELKVNSDTLRIKLHTANNLDVFKRYTPEGLAIGQQNFPFVVSIIVNNLVDIQSLPDTLLSNCITRIRKDVNQYLNEKSETNYFSQFGAFYNMKDGSLTPLGSNKSIRTTYLGQNNQLELGLNFGFRFLSGAPVTHVALGLRLLNRKNQYSLSYEFNGFYSKDNLNRVSINQNNFLSFGITHPLKRTNLNEFHILPALSIGKLINRQGDWLPVNTYRVGLPAVKFGYLQLQPELYFGKYEGHLKTSMMPSIKFSIYNF